MPRPLCKAGANAGLLRSFGEIFSRPLIQSREGNSYKVLDARYHGKVLMYLNNSSVEKAVKS